MLGDNLLTLCLLSDSLKVLPHEALDLPPLESQLIRCAVRMKAKSAGNIGLLIAFPIQKQFLPFVLSIAKNSSDKGLNLT